MISAPGQNEENFSDRQIVEYLIKQTRSPWYEIAKSKIPFLKNRSWIAIIVSAAAIITVFIFFFKLTDPPQYTEEQTMQAEARLKDSITGSSIFLEKHGKAMAYLKENHLRFYRKIMNAADRINGSRDFKFFGVFAIAYAKPVFRDQYLIGGEMFVSDVLDSSNYDMISYSSVLIHEADHLELFKSSNLNKILLFARCNPVFNPHLVLNFHAGAMAHDMNFMEICAKKEEIRFMKEVKARKTLKINTNILDTLINRGRVGEAVDYKNI